MYRIAGGETTSTFLAATTYYLLQNAPVYAKLQAEIRNAFTDYASITAAAAQRLPYLQAVISEGLRMYPPGSQGFPRLSPAPGTTVAGHWIPEGVSCLPHKKIILFFASVQSGFSGLANIITMAIDRNVCLRMVHYA